MSQRSSIRRSVRRRPSPSLSLNPSLAVLASIIPRQPHHLTYLRPCPSICPRRRPRHTFPSRRQIIHRLPLTSLPAQRRPALGSWYPRAPRVNCKRHSPSDNESTSQIMQQQAMRQGFCCEGTVTDAHGLLAKNTPAAKSSGKAFAACRCSRPALQPNYCRCRLPCLLQVNFLKTSHLLAACKSGRNPDSYAPTRGRRDNFAYYGAKRDAVSLVRRILEAGEPYQFRPVVFLCDVGLTLFPNRHTLKKRRLTSRPAKQTRPWMRSPRFERRTMREHYSRATGTTFGIRTRQI